MNNRELVPERIKGYLQSLVEEERAAATIEKYRRDILGFAGWLAGRPVTKETAAGWKAGLLEAGLSPVTVNAKLSAINGLFRFLDWEDCRVRFLKVQRQVFREPARELAKGDYIRLLDAAREKGKARLALVMECICATGIRVSEVRYITLDAARRGRAEIRLKGKVRIILLPGKLCRKLLEFARKQKIASGEIFLTKDGTSLSRGRIWRDMKALCQSAGVQASKVFPHNLRHLFATVFYRASRDIVKLADMLGHSSINTTRIYLMTTGIEHAHTLERLGLVS